MNLILVYGWEKRSSFSLISVDFEHCMLLSNATFKKDEGYVQAEAILLDEPGNCICCVMIVVCAVDD